MSDGGRLAADAESVEALLARMASATPAAGGGAAAALAGAAAAALVAMVAGVAARHAPADARLAGVADEARGLSRRLAALIARDEDAYAQVLEARRRTDGMRPGAVRRALRGAIAVPLEIVSASARVLVHAAALVDAARPSTLSDLGAAVALAGAALDAAALTARANLAGLEDGEFVHDTTQALERLLAQGTMVRQRLAGVFVGRASGDATPPR